MGIVFNTDDQVTFYRDFLNFLLHTFTRLKFTTGKRRYDRKQSGYGGQTKPIFRKKV